MLTDAYKDAADALSSIAGDPLLALMGIDLSEFVLQPTSLSPPVRVRE